MTKGKVRRHDPEARKPSGIGANKQARDDCSARVSFSFKYLDLSNEKFSCKKREPEYFLKLLERMVALCGYQADQLWRRAGLDNDALKFHSHAWDGASEGSFGLPKEEEFVDRPWQFSLSKNAHGRVHGFFIGTVFYVRWLDPEHNLLGSRAG